MTSPRPEPTEEVIRREIAAARRILREDKLIASHAALTARLDKHFPEAPEGTPQPPAPAAQGKPAGGDVKARRSVWWGDEE